jgi:YfiH family protein
MQQVHGVSVAVADPTLDPPVADIVISADPSLALAVQVADCVPLLLADRRRGAVAAAHAGWRGLAAGVPRITVEALGDRFGTQPADLVAVAGPSIGACCYEVGAEVRDACRLRFGDAADGWFLDRPRTLTGNPSLKTLPATLRPGHSYFDGWAAVRDQLLACGLEAGAIFLCGLCTASHAGTLCSYRRDGAPAGRLVGAIRTCA